MSKIEELIQSSINTKKMLLSDKEVIQLISDVVVECVETLLNGGKIIFCGNGGSFADAQHLSAEFTSRFQFDRAPLASVVLAANSSAISAIGNDYGFNQIFSRELKAIANSSDLLIAISTSGNSENVLEAVLVAKELNLSTFLFTGSKGGVISEHARSIKVPSNDTARIQECHILIGHVICGLVEESIFQAKE